MLLFIRSLNDDKYYIYRKQRMVFISTTPIQLHYSYNSNITYFKVYFTEP